MHWLMKSEPDVYGWDHLVRDGTGEWDGVRNPTAAKHLREMAKGDRAFFYHTGEERGVVAIMEVSRTAKPDGDSTRWVSVGVKPVEKLPRMVTLAEMKAEPKLADLPILRQPRLSVCPVSQVEWDAVIAMAKA
jgi:predicted RNA-binding protein with PUA-like domain